MPRLQNEWHRARQLNKSYAANKPKDAGLIIDKPAKDFVKAIAQHRFWEREKERKVPA